MNLPVLPDRGILGLLKLPALDNPDLPRIVATMDTRHLLQGLHEGTEWFVVGKQEYRLAVGLILRELRTRLDDGEFGKELTKLAEATEYSTSTLRRWKTDAEAKWGAASIEGRADQGRSTGPHGSPPKMETPTDQGFRDHKSVDDLAAEQGVGPIHDVEELAADDITEDEADAFVASVTGEYIPPAEPEPAPAPRPRAAGSSSPREQKTTSAVADLHRDHTENLRLLVAQFSQLHTTADVEGWLKELDYELIPVRAFLKRSDNGHRASTPYPKSQQVGGKR